MPSISIAEELAKKQREISISEFFERNKQILGYDSATKALLTAVKEGVDNSLDAGADADILPDILVEVRKIDKDEFVWSWKTMDRASSRKKWQTSSDACCTDRDFSAALSGADSKALGFPVR